MGGGKAGTGRRAQHRGTPADAWITAGSMAGHSCPSSIAIKDAVPTALLLPRPVTRHSNPKAPHNPCALPYTYSTSPHSPTHPKPHPPHLDDQRLSILSEGQHPAQHKGGVGGEDKVPAAVGGLAPHIHHHVPPPVLRHLAHCGVTPQPAVVVGRWQLRDGEGDDAQDLAGCSRDEGRRVGGRQRAVQAAAAKQDSMEKASSARLQAR